MQHFYGDLADDNYRTDEDLALSCSGIDNTMAEILAVFVWVCPECELIITEDMKNILHQCCQCGEFTSRFNKKEL